MGLCGHWELIFRFHVRSLVINSQCTCKPTGWCPIFRGFVQFIYTQRFRAIYLYSEVSCNLSILRGFVQFIYTQRFRAIYLYSEVSCNNNVAKPLCKWLPINPQDGVPYSEVTIHSTRWRPIFRGNNTLDLPLSGYL